MINIQSLLAIGALSIFALISVSFNSAFLENSTAEIENKVYLTAFSLADDVVEEVKQKAFDESTATQLKVVALTSLTLPADFGPETGESWPNFNDIDDYHGYSKSVSLPHAENYTVQCSVNYFDPANPSVPSSVRTFFKKIVITVSSPYMRSEVNIGFVFSLHSRLKG